MSILQPWKKVYSEKEIKYSEDKAKEELSAFVDELQTKFDVAIVPDVIIGINAVKGVVPITSNLQVVSNKRFKK